MSTERGHFIPKFPAWTKYMLKSFWEKFSDENKMEENPLFPLYTTLPCVAITSMKGKKNKKKGVNCSQLHSTTVCNMELYREINKPEIKVIDSTWSFNKYNQPQSH